MRHSLLSFISPLALAACGGVTDKEQDGPTTLSTFESCEAMEAHLTSSFLHSLSGYGFRGQNDLAVEASGGDIDDGADSSPSSYSTTNVQEKGVDEPDMVKTDGDYIYTLQDGVLSILRSWPAEDAALVSQIDVRSIGADGYTTEKMFLSGDRILAYTQEFNSSDKGWTPQTGFIIIDISDRSDPKVIEKKILDGTLSSARMIGSDVYTVMTTNIAVPETVYDTLYRGSSSVYDEIYALEWDASVTERLAARLKLQAALKPIVEKAVTQVGAEAFLPKLTHEDGSSELLMGCTDVLHSEDISAPGLTTVAHMDLDADTISISADATGVMAGATTVYASQENLYVAQSSHGWWDGISSMRRETRIHRLALNGSRSSYEATGVVDGFLHNQFSMSEFRGMLRVATTLDDWSWGTTTDDSRSGSNVYILDAEQSKMGIIGAVTELAPGEQIFAARFQGERAYLVTFVQVDPLFTIDLSQPTAPKAVGELKIPGYSAYLHPFGEDHLLGVGMAGDWDGSLTSVALSLFDVSDFSDPKQQDQLTLECSSSASEALWDHHAIMVVDDTVAIPVYGYTWDTMGDAGDDWTGADSEWAARSGLLVATVDTDSGLTKRGYVSHRPLVEAIYCPEEEEDCAESSYTAWMRRSLVIEDYLFSISDLGVMVSTMADPETPLASVPFL